MSDRVEATALGECEPPAKRHRCERRGTDRWEDEESEHFLEELLNWPQLAKDGFEFLFDMHWNMAPNLQFWFDQQSTVNGPKLFVTTHYTGLGTVEHCMQRLVNAHNSAPVVFYSAHEICDDTRAVLMEAKHRPNHVFGDLTHQFPSDVVKHMEMVVKVLRDRATTQMKAAGTPAAAKKIWEETSHRCMLKLLTVARETVQAKKASQNGYCYVHDNFCPLWPETNDTDLVLEGAGNSCVSFSPQGSGGLWLHESAIVAAIWMVQTEARKVDMVLQECSSRFNTKEAFQSAFPPEKGWKTTVLKLKCEDVGMPMVRWRNYSWTIRGPRLRLTWDFTRDDFLKVCQTPVQVDGHDFFCAPQDLVQDHLRRQVLTLRGTLQGHYAQALPFTAGLDVGTKVRLLSYQNLLGSLDNAEFVDKGMYGVVDLSQNCCVRQKLSKILPSFLTHSRLWSQWKGREMIPLEMMLAMGWPVEGLVQNLGEDDTGCPWSMAYLGSVKSSLIAKVTGNQMHARVLGLFMAFCLSVTEVTSQ